MINKKLFNMLSTGFLALTIALAFGFLSHAHAQVQGQGQEGQGETVMDVVDSNEELSTFSELLAETKLPELLSQGGPFTVIAPTDEAFENANIDPDQLKEDNDQLQKVIVSHLFRGTLGSDQVNDNTGATVQDGDLEASNGVVHVVEDVVEPKE